MDREDESLQTTHTGGEWKVAINPWSGTDLAKPLPVLFSMRVQRRNCPPDLCVAPYNDIWLQAARNWSDPSLWEELAFADLTLPHAWQGSHDPCSDGDAFPPHMSYVEIPAGYHIIMDINPPPLSSVRVSGRLEFLDNMDRTLDFETMVVWGEFFIGTEEQPFQHEATLTVHGNLTSETLV